MTVPHEQQVALRRLYCGLWVITYQGFASQSPATIIVITLRPDNGCIHTNRAGDQKLPFLPWFYQCVRQCGRRQPCLTRDRSQTCTTFAQAAMISAGCQFFGPFLLLLHVTFLSIILFWDNFVNH